MNKKIEVNEKSTIHKTVEKLKGSAAQALLIEQLLIFGP